MKGKSDKPRSGARFGDLLQSFTEKQLVWIGAVAMAYNEAEAQLHRCFGACIFPPIPFYELSSRMNGTEGICDVISMTAKRLNLPPNTLEAIQLAISSDGFLKLKSYRNAVIHSQLIDMNSAVAVLPGLRGKGQQEVLLTEEALRGLYARLAQLKGELLEVSFILDDAKLIWLKSFLTDQDKLRLEQNIHEATVRCLQHQSQRRSLPPLPNLPEPTQFHVLTPPKGSD